MYKELYNFPLTRFISQEKFARLKEKVAPFETPILLVDLDVIKSKYQELTKNLPQCQVYYALKANPMDEIIMSLHELGSNFDVASKYELDQVLALGISPKRVSYGNTIKKKSDIDYFFKRGVEIYVTDSDYDLLNLSEKAPGSKIFFRILTEGTGADWPLSRKFGSHPDMIYRLILQSVELGLIPHGGYLFMLVHSKEI